MVERFIRTLTQNLTIFVDKNKRYWDQHIPMLLMAYRSAEYELTEYITHPKERMLAIHKWERENLQFSSEEMKDRYNIETSNKTFKDGEIVWLNARKVFLFNYNIKRKDPTRSSIASMISSI
ncbi:hypothetical protein LAZ67_14001950 [Cordylochernes scorpioides]|uniref:Uncharacterized protein n=1 Tax=Cordylochernes scorpioides TaxID=51811 RepID=A0ABY6L6G0_9ARAC|nr:hypothetical protein LAZ67_14001950 [Cordylochernes scorpioides]